MHRQAMLVSLSLSPASTAAKNDKHWAFLDEIDAPQWADLKAEEALAKAGTIGDDLWFYRSHSQVILNPTVFKMADSYEFDSFLRVQEKPQICTSPSFRALCPSTSIFRVCSRSCSFTRSVNSSSKCKHVCRHHEVPLTEIAGAPAAANTKDSNSSIRTPNLERKKNRGSSKAKLAFDAPTGAKPKEIAKEYHHEESTGSPRAGFNACCRESFGADSPRMASPVHCKSPEKFLSARRFISSAAADECAAGNDGPGANFSSSSFRMNMFDNQFVNVQLSTEPTMPVSCSSAAGPIAGSCEENNQPSQSWQDSFFSKLKDTSRLRKSLGSALRVKIGDNPADNANPEPQGAATRPKSRLRQSVQLEAAALPATSISDRDPTFLKKHTASLRAEDSVRNQSCQSDRTHSGDANAELANKLGINSSVQAFDDIRKMRKSWGSALRVKVGDDSPTEDVNLKHDVSDPPPVSDVSSADKPYGMVDDVASNESINRAGSEEKKLAGIGDIVRAFQRRAQNPTEKRDTLNFVKEQEVSSPKIVTAAAKKYRRSVSFDQTPGRGTDMKTSTSSSTSTSSRSHLVQQKQGARASSVSRVNVRVEKVEKVSRLSKGGKENTSLHSAVKTTKLNPEPSTGSPRMGRQAATRMSMPSLTFAAHARAAMGAVNGGTILKPSGNGVVESNRSDSSKAAASAAKKSTGGIDIGSRKKMEPAVTNLPAKTITRQAILRSSMPVFSAAVAAKQASKPVIETGAAHKHGGKNSSKIGGGDTDLVALLAEHNRKFRSKPTYEPRIHSVKDIREWEARTGQLFYNLLPEERERANQEISAAKQTLRQK